MLVFFIQHHFIKKLIQQLNSQIMSNDSSKYCIEYRLNVKHLNEMILQISKIAEIINNLTTDQPLNMIKLLDSEIVDHQDSVPQLLDIIKKKFINLRSFLADKYAEKLSNNCENQ